ncbi:MAG: hypothetical protein ABEL76_10205 [Bradymonadaceae bacterium]
MPLFLWTAVCVPRIPRGHVLSVTGIVVAVGLSVGYGLFLADRIRAFERRELAPAMEVVESLPEGKRVECLNTGRGPMGGLRGWPMRNNCPGLVYSYTAGFGGFMFPKTGFNPVEFTEAYGYPSLGDSPFSRLRRLQWWDYLIVPGERYSPPDELAERVASSSTGPAEEGTVGPPPTRYALYRVRDPQVDASLRDVTGGDGGMPFDWPCPKGDVLRGLDGWVDGDGRVSGLRVRCGTPREETGSPEPSRGESAVESDRSKSRGTEVRFDSEGPDGPVIGSREAAGRFSATCPPGEFVVGLAGRSGEFVDRTDLLCAPVEERGDGTYVWRADEVSRVEGGGGSGGSSFRMICPKDSVVRGLAGRDGARLDAVGIICQEVSRIREWSNP